MIIIFLHMLKKYFIKVEIKAKEGGDSFTASKSRPFDFTLISDLLCKYTFFTFEFPFVEMLWLRDVAFVCVTGYTFVRPY